MALTPGTSLGVYEVAAKIGEGGMGEVYRATDTKLKRQVAIKILPTSLAADHDRLARFQREAEVLASLNHPNIAGIYGLDESTGITALVMELVEGEDLSQRIAHGAIPLDQALPIAKQIAEALEAAHEQGVIHRDLKPANIKIRPDGTVKVLDFGLAKAMEPAAGSSPSLSMSPTLSIHATQAGIILGTAAYMSPEQARGKAVDKRADVWAFGAVLFEMLTGIPPFPGDDISHIIARVIERDPDWSALPPALPPTLGTYLRRCLVKDPRQRIRDIGDVRLALEGAFETAVPQTDAARSSPRGRLGRLVAVAVAAVLVSAVVVWTIKPAGRDDAQRFVSRIPATPDTPEAFYDGFALSPDGSMLVYSARTASGPRQIWIREFDTDGARALPGTEDGTYPFWSPDGRSVAFFAGTRLKRVDVDGTRLQTICDVPADTFISGSWGTSGDILWAWKNNPAGSRIFKVPSTGGMPVALEALGDGISPVWLADGRRFLYAIRAKDEWSIRLASADGADSRLVTQQAVPFPLFSLGGSLMFFNQNDALTAQRLDDASGKLVGTPVPIAQDAGNSLGWFAVSSNGHRLVALVREAPGYAIAPGSQVNRLTWVDRQGRTLGVLGEPDNYFSLRLAPDGQNAGVNISSGLWLLRPDGRHVPLANRQDGVPLGAVWTRDGADIIFTRRDAAGLSQPMRLRPGTDDPGVPLPKARGIVSDWSSDGRWLLTEQPGTNASSDILANDVLHDSSTAWLATAANESAARFSPDGQWVAYMSDVSGSANVYLRRFDGKGQPIRVSTSGGEYPAWRRDGRELFFLSPGNDLMTASLAASGETVTVSAPQKLFSRAVIRLNGAAMPYDAAPDGQRFLLNVPDRPPSLFFLQGLDAIMGRN